MHTSGPRERLARQVSRGGLRRQRPARRRRGRRRSTRGHPPPRGRGRGARAPATSRPPCATPPRRGLAVAVQATGHGAAHPAEGTVLVSTSRHAGRQVDPVARSARVEAGVRWRSVIDAAAPHGLAPLSGSSSGVGVVGYTLGGGMGHLARRHGFAADRVRAVELVTADGRAPEVTAETDPELFWAVRGGQCRFGIVTALEFDLVRVPEFFGGAMFFAAPRSRRCCTPSPPGRRRCRRR